MSKEAKGRNPLKWDEEAYKKCKVEQCHKDRCDINKTMRRFMQTGTLPVTRSQARYGDFSSIEDYQTTLNKVIQAKNDFDRLPAEIRKEFGNDPGQLIAAMQDETKREKLEQLGILKKKDPVPRNNPDVNAPKEGEKEPKTTE